MNTNIIITAVWRRNSLPLSLGIPVQFSPQNARFLNNTPPLIVVMQFWRTTNQPMGRGLRLRIPTKVRWNQWKHIYFGIPPPSSHKRRQHPRGLAPLGTSGQFWLWLCLCLWLWVRVRFWVWPCTMPFSFCNKSFILGALGRMARKQIFEHLPVFIFQPHKSCSWKIVRWFDLKKLPGIQADFQGSHKSWP